MWVEGLWVVAPISLNLSKLWGMVCSGVSGRSVELVGLNVYKVAPSPAHLSGSVGWGPISLLHIPFGVLQVLCMLLLLLLWMWSGHFF